MSSVGLLLSLCFEKHQLLRALLEGCIHQIGRRLISLPQPLGQLQQVDAAQHIDGDGTLLG